MEVDFERRQPITTEGAAEAKEQKDLPSPTSILSDLGERMATGVIGALLEENVGFEKFDIVEFGKGFVDGIKSTGMNLSALAYYIFADERGHEVIGAKINKLIEHPEEVADESLKLAIYQLKDWLEASASNDYENVSYDVGKITGSIFVRAVTAKGLGTIAPSAISGSVSTVSTAALTSGELTEVFNPSLGHPGRMMLLTDMLREESVGQLTNYLPEAGPFVNRLWQEFERKMGNNVDPRIDEQLAAATKNLYMHRKDPQENPIKKETIVFIRDQLVDALYVIIENTELTPQNTIDFVLAFLALAKAIGEKASGEDGKATAKKSLETLSRQLQEEAFQAGKELVIKRSLDGYFEGKELSEVEKAKINIGLQGLIRSLRQGELPRKESLIVLTNGIIDATMANEPTSIA